MTELSKTFKVHSVEEGVDATKSTIEEASKGTVMSSEEAAPGMVEKLLQKLGTILG